MTRFNADIVIALLLIAGSTIFLVASFNIDRDSLGMVSAGLWPRIAIVVLGVLSFVYLAQSVRAGWSRPGRISFKTWLSDNRNVIACFALYALFLLGLPTLGMLLSGVLFVFVSLTVLGPRGLRAHALHLAIAVVSIGAMWAIFTFGLGVILPQGEVLPRW